MKKLYTIKNSKLHGKGLFAKQNIKAGTNVVEYVGEKITKAQSDKIAEAQLEKSQKNVDEGQVYIFTLDNKYDINGNVSYNNARLMNHSCNPNCDTDIVDGKIWIRSFRDIKKGDELAHFKMGSTVILLFEDTKKLDLDSLNQKKRVKFGKSLISLKNL